MNESETLLHEDKVDNMFWRSWVRKNLRCHIKDLSIFLSNYSFTGSVSGGES